MVRAPLPPPSRRASRWVVRHPVTAFLLWFFTIGQAFAFAPLVARTAYDTTVPVAPFVVASTLLGLLLPTLVITWIVDGSEGVRRLGRRICKVRAPLGWYAVAVLGVPLVTLALTVALYGAPQQMTAGTVVGAVVHGLLVQTLLVLLTSNLWEEVAWTGFVQARLQDRHGPLRAALLTAPLFALQHASLVVDNAPLAALLVMTVVTVLAIPFRALLGSAYNATGSLFIVGLIHAVGNGMTSGSGAGRGFLPRLYTGELIGIVHQLASAVLGIALIVATRGRLHQGRAVRRVRPAPLATHRGAPPISSGPRGAESADVGADGRRAPATTHQEGTNR